MENELPNNTYKSEWPHAQPPGPAFPSRSTPSHRSMDVRPVDYPGLSIWQYYAAHAPAIPNWFSISEDDPIPSVHGLNEDHKRQLHLVLADEISLVDASPEVQSFLCKFDEAKEGKDVWKRRMLERRFFAWRRHYANMMVQIGSEQP